jgi:hypothetical protein
MRLIKPDMMSDPYYVLTIRPLSLNIHISFRIAIVQFHQVPSFAIKTSFAGGSWPTYITKNESVSDFFRLSG